MADEENTTPEEGEVGEESTVEARAKAIKEEMGKKLELRLELSIQSLILAVMAGMLLIAAFKWFNLLWVYFIAIGCFWLWQYRIKRVEKQVDALHVSLHIVEGTSPLTPDEH